MNPSIHRLDLPVVRYTIIGLIISLALAMATSTLPASASDTDLDTQGAALVEEFITILKQPDADKAARLEDFLAEEFQIVRSNGATYDKAGYVANPANVFEVEISDVRATRANGVLVVSYILSVDEVLDGVATRTAAPRLSVFHLGDTGAWQMSAHANFGALDPS